VQNWLRQRMQATVAAGEHIGWVVSRESYVYLCVCILTYHAYRIAQDEVDHLMHKTIFESLQDLQNAVSSGAYEGGEVIYINGTWLRICASPISSASSESFIFWRMDTVWDQDPTWAKVVCICFFYWHIFCIDSLKFGGIVYNVSAVCKVFDESNQRVKDDLVATMIAAE
jgi:hypothetical protein